MHQAPQWTASVIAAITAQINKFALLAPADRAAILQETAARMAVGSLAIVEKDFGCPETDRNK